MILSETSDIAVEKTHGHALILEARFYNTIADHMAEGAIAVLQAAGMSFDRLSVPGSLEIPAAIQFAAKSGKYDCFVALGCIIRGETYHFEVCCNESARGLQQVALAHDLCIGNGIITIDTMDQALERARPQRLNKGGGAAFAAIQMLRLKRSLAA